MKIWPESAWRRRTHIPQRSSSKAIYHLLVVTRERWRQIEELYNAARENGPRVLTDIDPALRADVERLLARDSEETFLDRPALELLDGSFAPIFATGEQLGPYRIEVSLGAGGMGEVYRALDTRLGRTVAIKACREQFSERFHREAYAISSLNHPNVCTLYDIGPDYLVMEFVEGETLASRLERGKLSLEQTIACGSQIADALATAHAKGIVHRDLKPGNIMLTESGIKILDFGLAKAAHDETLTVTRLALGTPAYMAPEQRDGEKCDARTDIYALGLVLHEAATGKRFSARTSTEVPPRLRRIVSRCLQQDRNLRYQHASEARADLKRLQSGNSEAPWQWFANKTFAAGALAVITALAGIMWMLMRRAPEPAGALTQKRLTFNSSENAVDSAAISPDGKYLAYTDPDGIHVKLLSTGEERLIPKPNGFPVSTSWTIASWFPDGTQLLANAEAPGSHATVWALSALGQSSRELREDATGHAVSPDSMLVAFSPRVPSTYNGEIWVMDAQGDNPRKVVAAAENEWLNDVHWSPDSQHLTYRRERYSSTGISSTSIETAALAGSKTTVLSDSKLFLRDFCWLADGRLIYSRQESPGSNDENLWQIAVNAHTGAPVGEPRRLTQWAGSTVGNLSVSLDGKRLVLVQQTATHGEIYVAELADGGVRLKSPHRLSEDEAADAVTAWTEDSRAVLFNSDRNGTWEIFRQRINERVAEPLATGQKYALDPHLSPDGKWIIYLTSAKSTPNPYSLMRIPAAGGVPHFIMQGPRPVNHDCARSPSNVCVVLEESSDRKQLILAAFDPLKGRGKTLRTFENDTSFPEYFGSALSPDGSVFAIARSFEGQILIRLLSLSGGLDRQVTVKGWSNLAFMSLHWAPDQKGFYCGSLSPQTSTLLYVDLQGNARVLWQYKASAGGYFGFWGIPSPDGRYLAIQRGVANSNIWMLEGF